MRGIIRKFMLVVLPLGLLSQFQNCGHSTEFRTASDVVASIGNPITREIDPDTGAPIDEDYEVPNREPSDDTSVPPGEVPDSQPEPDANDETVQDDIAQDDQNEPDDTVDQPNDEPGLDVVENDPQPIPPQASSQLICERVDSIQNGSFEMVDDRIGHVNRKALNQIYARKTWDVFTNLPGVAIPGSDLPQISWQTTHGSGIEIQSSGRVAKSYLGQLLVELDSHANSHNGSATNTTMTQTLLLNPGIHKLSFAYLPRTETSEDDNRIGVYFERPGQDRTKIIDVAHRAFKNQNWHVMDQELAIYEAGEYHLSFAAEGRQNSYGGLLDNVSLTHDDCRCTEKGVLHYEAKYKNGELMRWRADDFVWLNIEAIKSQAELTQVCID